MTVGNRPPRPSSFSPNPLPEILDARSKGTPCITGTRTSNETKIQDFFLISDGPWAIAFGLWRGTHDRTRGCAVSAILCHTLNTIMGRGGVERRATLLLSFSRSGGRDNK